ncbi:MAG: acyl-[ACP]--phospholipid O-acyltransferase [Fuerstiella sp.]
MTAKMDSDNPAPRSLWSRSFIGYLSMSFLTAVNDSMFRWLIVPIAKFRISSAETLTDAQRQSNESLVLALGLGSFILPSIIFAPWSGWVADRFSKRTATLWLKTAEVVIMLAGVVSIWQGSMVGMFVVLFLTGTQSALLSTAKYGIIPEIVPKEKLSAANGVTGLVTLIAVIAGTVAGNALYAVTQPDGTSGLWISATALLGVAAAGLLVSLPIARVTPANPGLSFPLNPVTYSWRDIRLVMADLPILRVSLGIAFFWSLAALAQLNIDTFVINNLKMGQTSVGQYLAVLSLGVGLGSVLAGWWSGGRVELGMVPLGTALMALACVVAFFSSGSWWVFGISLAMIGVGGGLFNVPLNAYLQDRSPRESLGAILAAVNQITSFGVLLVSFLFPLMRTGLDFNAAQIFLVTGLGTFPILCYVVWLIPQATIRFIVWLLSRFVYRVRIHGLNNIPDKGAALLVANHVTWIDGVLILLASSRPIRMIAYADYVKGGFIGWLSRLFEIIPIRAGDGPRALIKSLNTASEALRNGELVCIFAEGQISRTGELLKFERGMMKILKGTDAPVLPVYLDELWGSIFSNEGGRFFWKKPKHWPYPVTMYFGELIPHEAVSDVHVVREAVLDLKDRSVEHRKERSMTPAIRFIRQCRLAWSRTKVADSAGTKLTGGRLLTAALAFQRLLTRSVLTPDEKMVGLLLPPSVGGAIANLAVSLSGRVSVNLNYTLSDDVVNYCIDQTGLKKIITSRKFMEKRPMKLDAELIYMEDLKEQIGGLAGLTAMVMARLMPLGMLVRKLGLQNAGPDDLMTIIFTSGSTGEPKGVMLSNNNITSNLTAANELLRFNSSDVLLGVLPFFHSFGYTITLWLPCCIDPAAVYHFNPLDSRMVGNLIEKHGVSIIAATPTFLRSYMKRCSVEQLKSVNLVITGAEKLPPELRDAWNEKYGCQPMEGYGTTELSPLAAVNVPDSRAGSSGLMKPGTVGKVIPQCRAAIFHPDTGEQLGVNQEGMLRIKGPNVMLGYLNHPEKTAEVVLDGWYDTGDVARIDENGFIEITGRHSRFSKIGGEMVPHIRIEQEITRIIDVDDSDEPEILCAVTALPDSRKGERLIVLHRPLAKPVREILDELQKAGFPNLWIPSADSFVEVDRIPLLGTGKLDLRAVKEKAAAHFCQ